jgi:hypothetical protein
MFECRDGLESGNTVTHSADVIDNLIAATLMQHGRVRPTDLVGVEESERATALSAYFERHDGASSLHFEGSELVTGAVAVTGGPAGAESPSDVDLLLEGYDGGDVAPAAPVRDDLATQAQAPIGESVKRAEVVVPDDAPPQSRVWLAWWAPVILVPLFGGIAAWFVLRHKHDRMARIMLGVGIGAGMLGSVLFLRYAGDIAGFASGASRGTVITLPAASTSTRPVNP